MKGLAQIALALLALAAAPAGAFDLQIWDNDSRWPGAIMLKIVGGDDSLIYQTQDNEDQFVTWNDVARMRNNEDWIMRFNPTTRPPTFYRSYELGPAFQSQVVKHPNVVSQYYWNSNWVDFPCAKNMIESWTNSLFVTIYSTPSNITFLYSFKIEGPWKVGHTCNLTNASDYLWRLKIEEQ